MRFRGSNTYVLAKRLQNTLFTSSSSHLTYTYGAHEVRSLRSAHVLLLAGVGSGVGVDGVDDDEDEEARFRLLRLQRSLARCLGACGVGALSASAPMEAEELEHMAKEVSAPYRKRPRREGVYPDFSTGGGGGGTASSPVKDAAESSTLFVPSSQSLNKEFISKFSCVVYIRPIYKVNKRKRRKKDFFSALMWSPIP